MAQNDRMGTDVKVLFALTGIFAAIALVVVLNGGSIVLTLVLLAISMTCGLYVVRAAVRRIRSRLTDRYRS